MMCLKQLCGIAQHSESDNARVAAIAIILDRGWGKAAQPIGFDGSGAPLQVIVRHIISNPDVAGPRVIEHEPVSDKPNEAE